MMHNGQIWSPDAEYLYMLYAVILAIFFEPTCANAVAFCLSVCLSVTRQKLLDNNSYLQNRLR